MPQCTTRDPQSRNPGSPSCPSTTTSFAGTAQAFQSSQAGLDRKSTRLNSSHGYISYAVLCLKKKIQLTKLGYDATPFNQILKQNAKREMRLRLGKVTVADVLAAQPVTTNLLKFMRASIKMIGVSNLQSFIASMTQNLTLSYISDESINSFPTRGTSD